MAQLTQKSFVTIFLLWSLKELLVEYIDVKQQETFEKLETEVDIISVIFY